MYKQVFDPVGDSLGLSSIFAAIPIVVLFVLLGGLKMKAHLAALIALVAALIVAIAVYGMPVGQALDSGLRGRGLRPVPDHVDRLQCAVDLQHDGGDRALRGARGARSTGSPTTSASRP